VSAGGAAGVEGSDGARAIQAPAAVVIDIEGTVGSIRFVKEVLFPFARRRLRSFVIEHRTEPAVSVGAAVRRRRVRARADGRR
jgi:methionine salvage enolase-phosphatase E1